LQVCVQHNCRIGPLGIERGGQFFGRSGGLPVMDCNARAIAMQAARDAFTDALGGPGNQRPFAG